MNVLNKLFFTVILSSFLAACGSGSEDPSQQSVTKIAPIAVTANDFSADENTNQILDGSASSDSDGTISSYAWVQTAGPNISITNVNQSIASFTTPDVDTNTQLTFQLTVTDDVGETSSDTITISIMNVTQANQAPTAVTANDYSADENTNQSLDGRASTDSDGTISSYAWVQTAGPNISITNVNQSVASFTSPNVDTNTQLIFQLTVTDNAGANSSDTITVSIMNVIQANQAPTAVTANDYSADENTTQTLNGSSSSDPDGTIVGYMWVQTSGTSVAISNANQANASFVTPDIDSDVQLGFQLTVTDDAGATNSDTITVSIVNVSQVNQAPSAVVVNDFNANVNSSVVLNGSSSSDSDGIIASYSWGQTAGSPIVVINNPTSANASFTAPDVSSSTPLTFQLMVTDNEGLTDTASVTVTIKPIQTTVVPRAASRTTGVAPLSVFFTAGFSNSSPTNREFHDLDYSWNFGDASSGYWSTSNESKNTDKGPVASHLFETAGTYTVSLSVRNASGIVDTDTFTILVTDPNDVFSGTKTTCFSDVSNNNFTDCPAGANQVTTDNIGEMGSYVGNERRVLLHRGSVWSRNGRISFSDSTTVQIGAYGTCQTPDGQGICSNAPHISLTGNEGLFDIDRMHDLRIVDVNVSGSSTADGLVEGGIDTQQLLVLRVKTTGHENALAWKKWRDSSSHKLIGNAIISSSFSGAESNIIFIGSEQLSFIGNVVADSKAGHATRIWFSYQGVISHNIISGADYASGSGLQALKFHGPSENQVGTITETGNSGLPYRSKFTVVSNNVFGGSGPWPIGIGPQSARDVYDERLSDIIIEKNKALSSYGRETPKQVLIGMMLSGRYFTARNNVLDGTGGGNSYKGIQVVRRGYEATPLGNRVYNNTIYRGDTATGEFIGVEIGGNADDTIVRNNFVSFPSSINQVLVADYSGDGIVDHNVIADDHGFVDPNNSNSLLRNFSLISTSPAINQGTDIPVLDDFIGQDREINSYTVGAFQF